MLFNEKTSDVWADHIDFEVKADVFAVLFGHHEQVAVDFLEFLDGVTKVINCLFWGKGLVLNHKVEELNQSDTDSVPFWYVTNKLNFLVRDCASVGNNVSNDGLERFSHVVGLLVFEKGDINLLSKWEVESAALQVFAEVFFEGTDLWDEGDFEFVFEFVIDFRGLAFGLFEEQVFQQVRSGAHNG